MYGFHQCLHRQKEMGIEYWSREIRLLPSECFPLISFVLFLLIGVCSQDNTDAILHFPWVSLSTYCVIRVFQWKGVVQWCDLLGAVNYLNFIIQTLLMPLQYIFYGWDCIFNSKSNSGNWQLAATHEIDAYSLDSHQPNRPKFSSVEIALPSGFWILRGGNSKGAENDLFQPHQKLAVHIDSRLPKICF